MDQLLGYFKPSEFDCKCGTCGLGYSDMQRSTIDKLVKARQRAGVPFILKSAMRCPGHNQKEGGKDTSAHLKGYALDIAATTSRVRLKILESLIAVGFRRVGIANGFIHADDDPSLPADVCWLY